MTSAAAGPTTITIVAAIARNGVIGHEGGIPWHRPGDQRRAKELTMGHVLVMGRRTYESIGRPLPGRTSVVVTRQPDWQADGVVSAPTVDAALEVAAELDSQVFVFGGAEIYAAALPRADRMVITWIDESPVGDTTFPDVDWSKWREVGREPAAGFTVVEYERALDPAD
jgi:dihydrofolate reductase